MKKLVALLLIVSLMMLAGCGEKKQTEAPKAAEKKPEMLFYIGITMVKPITALADKFMVENNCDIKIIQGGSQDLYDSIKSSGKGDLYLPGSLSYRKNFLSEGLLLDAKFVGYNKAALMVAKGNPKNIPADLNVLSDKKYKVVLCNPDSGSIGNETKKILEKFGNFEAAMANAAFLTTDSRNLTNSIKDGTADVCLNWYATTLWDGNKEATDAIVLDEKYAEKKKLVLNLLKSSKHPELTKKFMEYAASQEGRQIFYKFGFLDDEDLKNFDSIKFE